MRTQASQLSAIPCTRLSGVGPKIAEKLQKCAINTIQDLLFHLPFRYQDRTHVTPIINLRPNDFAVIEGVIQHTEITGSRKPSLLVTLRDGSGQINLRFFHFMAAQQEQLAAGTRLRCFGEVKAGFRGGLEMFHPEYRRILAEDIMPVDETLTPIYPTTEGLNQKTLQNLTAQALRLLEEGHFLQELLPEKILRSLNMPALAEAIAFLHRPPPDVPMQQLVQQLEDGKHPAQQRLAFEELLAHRLSMRKLRAKAQSHQAPRLQHDQDLVQKFLDNLPFKPTNAQVRVNQEISHDLLQNYPMLRLVQGDVGSGKTLVAAVAMLQAVSNGYQAALMAPTDLLAEQHYYNFSNWLANFGISIAWLAGKHKGKLRSKTLETLKDGTAQIIIGTHALFQDLVQFNKLGLIVVDEQHRFGVHQRLALREKGANGNEFPHQLIMTATPIPRTLSMTAYADLDFSVIDELPPGRTPVKTVVISDSKRHEVIVRIQQVCQEQRQVYWVCPLIEESEILQCQAAEKTFELLLQELPHLRIALIHGRLKPKEKELIMWQFKQHEIDLLVATTVIEVGVDVPNASLMIMENAERLGLSQLHQLRGRVGRGATESFCVLLYQSPLSHMAKQRLSIMRESTDGFLIAQKDLELRGPGEVLGTKQTGLMQFRIADLKRDQHLLEQISQVAAELFHESPEVADAIIQRWLGDDEKYGVV